MVLGHQAIDAHHPVRVTVQPARIAQQEVIRMGIERNGVGLTGNTRPAARMKALSTIGCDAHSSKTGSSETRDPSITTLPTSRKFTVILSPIFDCTCPTPQSGSPG